jgi:pimeloyl-ACP methyl ester carboxylesterase
MNGESCRRIIAFASPKAADFSRVGSNAMLDFCNSWNRVRPVTDSNGSSIPGALAEKRWVDVNGTSQGMFIRSASVSHPVLLFVHGGPAMPAYTLDRIYHSGLERDFTTVWWEQRGAGLSFGNLVPKGSISIKQIIEDTIAMGDYLRSQFNQTKVYLMGHSWGSFIGIQAAAQAPDRFHAYIGMGQVTNQLRSERLAHEHALKAFRALGDRKMVQLLESACPDAIPLPPAYMAVRDAAMHKLGVGTTRGMNSVITGMFLPTLLNTEYTLRERINIWRGKWSKPSTDMWNNLLRTDITRLIPKLDLPVYLLEGRHDKTTSYDLSRAYFDALDAPLKGFYTFDQSAHSPVFEEPDKARSILVNDVLNGKNELADR